MNPKEIISAISTQSPNITSVFFVGCGASMAELYPAHYFLTSEALHLRSSIYTSNEFNMATPSSVNENSIVITCSLGGNTPETVEASKIALKRHAKVIAITHHADSPLAENADYVVVHGFEKNYAAKLEKMTNALHLAVDILHTYEDYTHYEEMMDGMLHIYDLIEESVSFILPSAKEFAENYKDSPQIYVMSSGATSHVAYSFSICLLMEMQWINSGSFNDGEFFHGPFEIVDKNVPFLLLMNEGKTRPMDSRALDFLNRFEAKTTVIDAKDFGIGSQIAPSVVDYFNPMLITAILRVYAEQLAIARNHPLSKRRYMWKLQY